MNFLRKNSLSLALLLFILLNILIWQTALSPEITASNELKVYFLDIGQGDATFIEAPNGNQVLIDGGRTDNKVLQELGEVMTLGDRTIDLVIATHPDADHIGGLPEVFKRFEIKNYIESGNQNKNTAVFNTLTKDVEDEKDLQKVIGRRGMVVILDKERGIYLQILFPDRDVSKVESNAASVIIRLVYGDTSYVFMADAPQGVERHLLSLDTNILDSDVLKVGHHGSKTSTAPEFLEAVSPEYAVISVGAGNTYGHPNKETLDTLQKDGIQIFRTDEDGRIEIDSDGLSLWINK